MGGKGVINKVFIVLASMSLSQAYALEVAVAIPKARGFFTVEALQPGQTAGFLPFKRSALRITITTKRPIFYILVHGTYAFPFGFDGTTWGESNFSGLVPQGFFVNTAQLQEPAQDTEAIRISFGWIGLLDDYARKFAGKKLAEGINKIRAQLKRYDIIPTFILLGHSHGGNVINVASQYVDEPIDMAIELATPILAFNTATQKFDNNTGYLPKNIKELFLFFSMQDFVQPGGSVEGAEHVKRRFSPLPGINLYNIMLRVNGNYPLHIYMHDEVIGKRMLQLVKKIKDDFLHNKNLVAHLTNVSAKQEADMLVAIKPAFSLSMINVLDMGTPRIDALWPAIQGKYAEEETRSVKANDIFRKIYGSNMWDIPPVEDRLQKVTEALEAEAKQRLQFIGGMQHKLSEPLQSQWQKVKEFATQAKDTMKKGVQKIKQRFQKAVKSVKNAMR